MNKLALHENRQIKTLGHTIIFHLTCVHYIVYTNIMKNITFSAKEDAIEKARRIAKQKNSTLNEMFREWLDDINNHQSIDSDVTKKLHDLWDRTSYISDGKKLTREEMHER
jgi:hypothetical protein